eukprot:7451173-Alexandrium_andersonii.AAC.1
MEDRFARAADFEHVYIRDTDVLPEECYASVAADVGVGAKLRPPSGHYVGLASGAASAQLDLSAIEPPKELWRPR